MNNRMSCPVMLLVGVGIGVGVGMLISKPTIDKGQKELDLLLTQMQTATAESKETIQKAKTEIARTKNLLMQTTTQLATAHAELQEIKSRNPESPATLPEATEPVVVITTPGRTAGTVSTTRTTDYTIKEGDSFWKIAQEQLGDGLRYKEILKLNPDISENQTLNVGTKIKIPAQ